MKVYASYIFFIVYEIRGTKWCHSTNLVVSRDFSSETAAVPKEPNIFFSRSEKWQSNSSKYFGEPRRITQVMIVSCQI